MRRICIAENKGKIIIAFILMLQCSCSSVTDKDTEQKSDDVQDLEAVIYKVFDTFRADTLQHDGDYPRYRKIVFYMRIRNNSDVDKYFPVDEMLHDKNETGFNIYKDSIKLATVCMYGASDGIVHPGNVMQAQVWLREYGLKDAGIRSDVSLLDLLDEITIDYESNEKNDTLPGGDISDLRIVWDKNLVLLHKKQQYDE